MRLPVWKTGVLPLDEHCMVSRLVMASAGHIVGADRVIRTPVSRRSLVYSQEQLTTMRNRQWCVRLGSNYH